MDKAAIPTILENARMMRQVHTGKFKTVRLPWWRAILKRRRTVQVEMGVMELLLDHSKIAAGTGDTWREVQLNRIA